MDTFYKIKQSDFLRKPVHIFNMKRDFLKEETFEGTFPYEPHYMEVNGFSMHYVDEGEGEPIVCFHGEPDWGYLYRQFIKELSKTNRIIVPDMMGFGKSDVPQDKAYILEEHVDNVKKLLLNLDLKNITIVVQDWGGPIGFGFAVDYPERIKRLVIMNTSIGVMKEEAKPWYHYMEKKGTYEEFLKDPANILQMGMVHKEKLTPTVLRAYNAPFPSDEYYIGVLAWPKDIPVGEDHPSAKAMMHIRNNLDRLSDKDKILIWGMKDPIFPKWMTEWWNKIYPGIETHKIVSASHFLQEDAPEEIIALITQFLAEHP